MEAAFAETYRVLKPGGKLIATYWINFELAPISKKVITALTGKVAPPPPINPMALSEDGKVEGLLFRAGSLTFDNF